MKKKKILILDNDGTLSKFKNGNFSDTIGKDLKINIKNYITDLLGYNEKEYNNAIEWIKSNKFQLSEGFEKLGVDRKIYLYETWRNLEPEDYLIDRGNKKLRELIEKKEFINIMITGAPEIWFKNSMKFLGYDLDLFNKIYTANDFYHKENVNSDIFKEKNIKYINECVSIGDEINDFIHLQNLGGIGININKSKTYK